MVILSSYNFSQDNQRIPYSIQEISKDLVPVLGVPQITANDFKVYQINVDEIKQQLVGIGHREHENSGFIANVLFPHPDGSMHEYRSVANSTMHPDLAANFPEIKTYDASGNDGSFVKWDITPKGLHVMIMKPGESTIFIDPIFDNNDEYYIVYRKKDFFTSKTFACDFNLDVNNLSTQKVAVSGSLMSFGTCELRSYRLALAATGEYTTFHGGTVALALAAQVTTMNRVNGVYERDMAITMNIIANNNLIIYTNAGSDPYANGTPGTMINQNQTNIDAVIGNSNYDIGHVFGTNSGGLAGLGVVCNNSQKARGVTGSAAPINDPFDIDYVAHEMGHQFGANHTQNNPCNSVAATRMEPGSASTIMGYAGICPPNVQSNSDDHFHGISLEEIGIEILSGGHTCEQITALANNPPVVTGTNGNVTVPANTPFALTAFATDPDGDPLSYCWEQMNNQASTQPPVATSTGGPNFRSNSPVTDPTRYFPNLADLAAGISPTWEVIPSVTRTMNFRVSVRDNSPGPGGCNDHADITLTTDAGSGPFIVLYPSATGIIWAGASSETVTWDVANTDNAPVNCTNVDILLSIDGGLTYPYTLATGVANDGSELIAVPNVATTTARVMVISSAGTFFDISNNDFEITMATFDFTQSIAVTDVSICQPSDATYTVDIGEIGGYTDPVTLSVSGVPAGATSSFSVNPVNPVGSSILTITNTGAAAPGVYSMTVSGTSTTGTKNTNITLTISDGNPSVVSQIAPTNGATAVAIPTTFTWTTAPQTGVTYEIDIATDAGFTTIVDQATGLAAATYNSAVLLSSTTYYWRVRAVTGCGQSAWSGTYDFTTNSCNTYASTDVGQQTNVASFTSTLNIPGSGTITDLNVVVMDISHPWVGDIGVTLTSPTGTVVQLFDGPGIPASTYGCAGDNIDVTFDDGAALTATNLENMCNGTPPAIVGDFQSIDPLANFNGESITGNWILTVYDSYTAGDVGTLNAWSLEICTAPPVVCNEPDVPTASGPVAICEGENATLTITGGNLNDATDWTWYSGSCGGNPEGSGTSLVVSPTTSTSYFVRGEGGCATPAACYQIDVQVDPISNVNETNSVCSGGNYTYPDGATSTNITVTEMHTSMLSSVVTGCDSIVITTINVDPTYTLSDNQSICSGQSFTFPDGTTQTNITADVSYVSNLTTVASGCDSTITTNITVVAAFNMNETASICNGDVYTFPDGTTGNTAQVYTSSLMSTGGCDSIIVTTLSVNPTYNSNESATICNGEVYMFPDGTTGTTAQVYTSMLSSISGCDSIIVTTLSVNSVDVSVTDNSPTLVSNASGANYQWLDCDNGNSVINGETNASYTATAVVGNYAVEVTQNGCTDTSACYLVDQNYIDEFAHFGVNIYPNPSSSSIQIEWNGAVTSIELTDVRGRLLQRIEFAQVNSATVDLSTYSSGVYFVTLETSEGRIVNDIIKQ